MPLYNSTGIIGQALSASVTQITGSLALTCYIILLILMALCIMLQIPLEFAIIVVLPLTLVMAAYVNIYAALVLMLLYLAAIIAKNFFFR